MLPSCHSELRASDAQGWAAYNTHIVTILPDTVLNVIVLDTDIGSIDTVCGQNSLSHQKQKEKIGKSVKKEPSGQIQITIMLSLLENNSKWLNGAAFDCCWGRNDQKGMLGRPCTSLNGATSTAHVLQVMLYDSEH